MIDAGIANSRFIAFFDECGDHSLVKINPQLPVFVLCTLIVEREVYARRIVPEIAAFKLRYFPHEGVNLHSRDIRKAEGPFSILQNAEVRERFMDELTALMESLPFTLFATVIRKDAHLKRYGDEAANPYNVALEYSFERILHFMEANRATDLPVIAEARGKNEDNELRASFHRLMTRGTYYNEAERFRRLVCPLAFRRKHDNIAGIQLADLCAHPIARRIIKPNQPNRAFSAIEGHFYAAGRVKGLKVFP
ncbi:3-deoxy-D-manno-octulosonic acid transferase [Iodidimonas muriae]|uniref:3-deoxy-D-manno-octulosonic acid transferase n=1 Tax=Iodidimonas muriae TaxID=261467 RepID=A0ABQ2LFZ7_9PROT|nr:DUF3800 domain-containing protein [Iodidimonas muriae]GER07161.1 3-deoxy-D-manno-octulosonic acid transferase [Kordiimonadales bacterium JCM 17843]GGO12793.1 3-deoxy-D-manno-octulosonic acid transferase [Iodidimonas muriae]